MLLFPDVNECELLSGVCGEAFCENVEGSFLCVCADENQEYSPMTGQCRRRASEGKLAPGALCGGWRAAPRTVPTRCGPNTVGMRGETARCLATTAFSVFLGCR